MQDNNWKDDAEFYDDAWADMNVRLSKRNQPKPGYKSRWLLLALFPLLMVGAYFYTVQNTDTPAELPQSVSPPNPDNTAVAMTQVQSTGEAVGRAPDELDGPTGVAKEIKGTRQANVDASSQPGSNRVPSRTATPNGLAVAERGTKPSEPVPYREGSEVSNEANTITPNSTNASATNRRDIATRGLSTSSKLSLYSVTSLSSPDGIGEFIVPSPFASSKYESVDRRGVGMSGEITASSTRIAPGYGVNADYGFTIGPKGRLTLSPSLGYSITNIEVTSLSVPGRFGSTRGDVLELGGFFRGNVNSSPFIYSSFEVVSSEVMKYSSVDVGISTAYQAAPKLSFGLNFTAHYLTAFTGPSVYNPGIPQPIFGFSLPGSENIQLFNDPLFDPIYSIDEETPTINLWQLTTSANVGYALSNRWMITTELILPLNDVTDFEGVTTNNLRVGLNLRYRIR